MKIQYGITGNWYITSIHKSQVISICQFIGKAKSSIYYSDKYNCWCARIKCKLHKENLKQFVEKLQ